MISRQAAFADVAVVLGCSSAYVVASFTNVGIGWIIPVIVVVLVAYYVIVLRRRGESWRDYGVRADNLLAAGWRVGLFTLVTVAVMVVWAAVRGEAMWRREMLLLVPLYPLWGIVQQLIFQGILHRRLLVLIANRWIVLALNSLAFGIVHAEDWRLVVLTSAAGFVWSWFYQRWPNVWVLGLSHGVLAALAYPLVLAENPLDRIWQS